MTDKMPVDDFLTLSEASTIMQFSRCAFAGIASHQRLAAYQIHLLFARRPGISLPDG